MVRRRDEMPYQSMGGNEFVGNHGKKKLAAEHICLDKIPPFQIKFDERRKSPHFWRRHNDLRTRRQRAMHVHLLGNQNSAHRIFFRDICQAIYFSSSLFFSLFVSRKISGSLWKGNSQNHHPTSNIAKELGKGGKKPKGTQGVHILYRLEFFAFFFLRFLFSCYSIVISRSHLGQRSPENIPLIFWNTAYRRN